MAPPSPTSEQLISVLLVDDHLMFREHLRELINRSEGMTVCGEAESVTAALDLVAKTTPDVAVVDITLRGSNGLELVRRLNEQVPQVKVLVLSMHEESLYGERAMLAGATSYLTKHQSSAEVIQTIHRMVAGETCGSRGTARAEVSPPLERSAVESLAGREMEVFTLLGRGKGTREIAETLQIAESTVETYRSRIKEKLGLRSAAQLYVRAGNWLRDHGG